MKKNVKFSTVKINQDFYIPDHIRGFESIFIKINESTYADKITKQCYWNDGEQIVIINEKEKENETKKRIQKKV